MSEQKNTPALIAYQVTQRGSKSFWNRIGAAWPNKAGGFQVELAALPVDGQLVLMPPKADSEAGA